MQSTRPALIKFLRISPSPDWLDDMEPLASTNPAVPRGARWWTMCCTQAKLAFALGRHAVAPALVSSARRSPPQFGDVEGRVGEDEVGPKVGCRSLWKLSPWAICPSMPRMARFIWAIRQVVWFDSWPQIEMSSRAFPPLPLPVA